jgi:hypothetical protein
MQFVKIDNTNFYFSMAVAFPIWLLSLLFRGKKPVIPISNMIANQYTSDTDNSP